MPDNVDKLFEIMQAKGAASDRDKFRKVFLTPGNKGYKIRKDIYDGLRADGIIDSPTYEDFRRKLRLGGTPTVNKYRQQMFSSVDPNKSRASELTHRAVGQAVRATNNVRKPVVAKVVNQKGKPTGKEFAITPAKTVEDLDREYAQEATKNWENELHDQIADADKDAAKISDMFKSFICSTDEVGSVWGNMTRGGGIAGTPHSVTTNNGILENTEARQILAAGDYNRKRRELLQLEKDSRNGAIFDNHSFFRGMYDAAKDTGFLTGGASDLINAGSLLATKQDLDNGVHTEAGDMLMQQAVKNSDAQSQYGDNQGWMYTGGVITTNMAPFMMQVASAGFSKGMSNAIGKVVQGAASKVALGTMEKATGMAGAHIANYIGKVTGLTTKAFGKAIQYGIVGAAQANTVGLGNVANDVINRYTGQVYQDEHGNYKFGTFDTDGKLVHEGGEDFLTALVKGEAAQTIEFATELAGGGIDAVGTALKNFVIKGGKKIINKYNMDNVSKVIDFLLNNKVSKNARYLKAGADRTLGKVELNSIVGESLEEELGIIANTVFTGDNKISDLWDEKQQSQIWGGMLLSIGLMKGAVAPFHAYNAKQYYSYKHKLDKADVNLSQLLGKEKWEELRNQIDATTNDDMPEMVNKINRDVALGKNRQPVREYIQNLLIMRGYDIGNMLAAKKAVEDKGEGVSVKNMEKNQAYQQGRDAYGYDTHEIQLDQEDKQKSLAQLLGISEQQLASMSDEELEALSGRDDNIDRAIYDYQLSTARYEGVIDNARDQIDLEVQRAAQAVDMYTDKSRNTIRNATIKATGGLEDYGVYIINGNIATHEDGSIDISNSDDMILYYDPTTNTVEHADAMMFAELGSEENADEVRNQAMADAKEKAIKETTGIIDGVVDVGTQFKTVDADGTEHTYEVLADNGDGTSMITIDGNVPTELVKGENVNVPVSFEELQKMKDASDQQRLQAAKAQREQMEKERAEQQNQETEQTQPSFDFNQILNDNGNVVLADVLDKDGNTKYPNSQLFLIRDSGAKAKVVELKSDGTIVPHAVNKEDVATISSMSLDEYKQAMPESSMIEDNSGENRGEIEVETPTIEGETAAPAEETAAPESAETPATEQTPAVPAITLEDGTIVPMLEDGNPDFSKLTAAQTAELYDSQFGEDADSIVSGYVSDAKKALDKASNMTVKGKTFVEQKAAKDAKEKAIADAKAAYDSAIAIRDAYNERQLAKVEDTAEGRKELIEKARRKFARLKSAVKDDAEAVAQIYKETVGSLLHRLYDGTGIDVTDTIPLTAEEYVASNLGAHSLNYEGTETSKGVKQETGLSRKDFAETQLLAADGKGTTIDNLVHSLWENRPSNLDSLDTQDIRNALLSIITSGFKASEARNYIENLRIARAENFKEEEKKAADNAAFAKEQKAKQEEEQGETEQENTDKEKNEKINEQTNENINAPEQNKFPDKLREGSKTIEVPEDATDENPLGLQLSEDKVPFEIEGGKSGETYNINDNEDRQRLINDNKVDDKDILDIDMPKHVHKAIKELCKKMGLKVQFLYMGARSNGWIENGTMYLALDTEKATQFVFGHEMTHAIKQKNPEAYKELVKVAMAITTRKKFEEDLAKIYQNYYGISGYNNIDDYVEEVVADKLGKFINDFDLAQKFSLRLNHPVLATILHAIQKIKGLLYGDFYKSVDALERIVEKAYVDTAKGEITNSETGEDVSFSLRQKPEPKKKGIGYKVFVLKDGKLYPPMVANPDGAATPVGVWLDADAAPIAGESKTGRPQVKQGGKGTQGGSGKLAYRPGWHLGIVPYAIQFNRKDADGNKTLFPKNFVFAEVEYAADVDYQEEARQEGINPSGKYQHSLAGLKHLPTDGYYMYRTNPNPETDPWVITGAMKVNRILTRAEQAELVKNAGREPQQIQEGDIVTDDVVNSINQEIADAPKFSLKDNQENPLNQDGTLKLDKIKSVDELTDEDFTSAFRNVELPAIPKNVDAAIGANGKPIVIKKNIFEKNWNAHKFTPAESKKVLNDALYNTDLVGHTQPTKKPNHWVAIKLDEKSPITVLEVNDNKDNVEVVGWYTLDERNLGRIKRQAERNGGELIMLTPKDDKVESLSTPPLSSAAKIDNSSETAKENGEKFSLKDEKIKSVAEKFGVNEDDVAMYANAVEKGSTAEAARARANIKRYLLQANEDKISSFKELMKYTVPVNEALKENFGDLDAMIEERRKQVEAERNAMEAARKRAQEEEEKRQKHLDELSLIPTDELDKRYMDAISNNDESTAREMLDESARRNGYGDVDSDYQGQGAWAAPSNPQYESDEARRADIENSPDVNLEDIALGYSLQPDDYFDNPRAYMNNTAYGLESAHVIKNALDAIKNGEKDVKVKVYRAVPTSVKEGKLRNGDWVTPSKKYAEMHGDNRLEGKYRIIEDEVPANQLWWDGNDANEFGFDDGKEYRYKNAKNNRKLNDLITYDNKGYVIPPSKRFNSRKNDIRFSLAGERGAAAADKAEERTFRMDNLSVARKMEEKKKDAKAIKMATGWERGADGKWRYEMPDAKIKDTMDVGGGHIVKRYEDDMLWNGGKLFDVIDAPELFKAYPQLKGVRIDTDAIMNDMPSHGEYDSKTNTITIHADELKYMNDILNHEIQHAIQGIEGFATGGSPTTIRGEVKKRFNEVTKQIKQLRAEGKEDEAKALIEKNRGLYDAYMKNDDFNSYKSLAGEVEARNVQERMNMTPEERRKTLAESTEDVARKDQIFLGVGDVSFSLHDMADGKESGAADMAEDLKSLNTPDEVDDAIKTAIDDMPSGWQMANKKMVHIAQALGENRKAEIAGEEPKFSLKDGTLIKAGTYFSGGGLVEEGLKGIIDPVVAVEYDEKISGVYRNNFGQHIVTADVRDVDPKELVKQIDGDVEYFHASPVCKNYSQAKSNHAEVELDKETAASTAEFINAIKPKVVTIENVKGYKDSEAMKTITDALDANGYTWDADVYNAADYGGYTNRERLIVRAVRDGKLPEKPKKIAHKSGWYEAVADIIPTLTEKKNGVAPWMDIRLKADGIDWRNIDKPLYVMGSAYADGKVPHAFADELLPTLRTKSGDVIVMPDGKVYRAMGRVLARVSGVSDDYKMPFSESLSHTIIGNGIPTQLTEHVIAPLLTGSDPKFSIRTYHGTGASFDKFDLSHALEGEGSETFGHGVYVTNSSKIGREYAQRAKQRKMADLYKNMRYPDGVKDDIFKRRVFGEMVNDVATGGSVASAKEFAKKRVGADANDIQRTLENLKDREKGTEYEQNLKDRLAEYKDALKWIDSIDEDYLTQGNANRYDVDIPDDNGNYLGWNDSQNFPLEKWYRLWEITHHGFNENEYFKDGGARYDKDRIERIIQMKLDSPENGMQRLPTLKGEELYHALEDFFDRERPSHGAELASRALSEIGFVGIKYPAGLIHGGAEEGDYNYVIFDENNANIVGNTRFSLRYDQFEHDLNQWKKDNNLPKDAQRPTIPQRNAGESAVDFLRRVDEYRKQMALWKTAPTYEQHLLSDDTALGEFNRELQRGSVLKRIAFQDSMLAIRKAQEAIMKEVGVDRLNMAEDAYTAENRSHGKGKNEFEEYNNEFLQPLRKAYHQMKKILGDSYDNVRIYMMAKHGLERDSQMAFKKSLEADYEDVAQRSAAYKAYKGDMNRIINDSDLEFGRVDFTTWRQRDNALRAKYSPSYMNYRYDKNGIAYDYSGLSALFDGSDFEEAAYKLVKDIEDKYVTETHNLWDATNAATKKILRDGYKAGMMSKDTYQYVRDMYSHYIPLRGWDGTTADQVWDYIGGGKGAFNQTLKKAHGRTSIADDPIAYIENMAESGILLNNKNWVKQHLMLLAQNHPTSLLTLSKAWYVKSTDANGNEEWIPATPQISSQMNSNQVKAAIDAFEKKMEQMAQAGDATQKRDGLNIAYPQTHSEEREHEVRVMKDGDEYVIYVNGDPQLAQAMNNTRAHRVREIQSGKLDRAAAWLGRKMAAAYTSLSPLFIPSNYFRDLTMTLASTAIREDGRYNYLLRKNLATSWNLGFMLRDYQNGKLRDKVNNGNATPKEQMFYDFMMNGGETGFVSSLDVEDLKKKFKNDLKDLDRWKANPVKVGHTIMDSIEFLNRMIEDSNRFAVYMTSIQYGRSIDEAVNDAKDVTLNFNRKGTGEHSWQTIRNLYLFINPAVQSLQTLGALAKHHPFKFTAVTASWLASGVLVPIVNAALMSMLGGDDDKDKYWQFTKWDRRNNLIMWVPYTHEYVKIPLAQEFRAFYGIGDMIASKMMGGELAEESWSQYAEDLLGQVVDMLPLDPTGYDGNIAVSLMPNAIRPVFELAFNVDFTGKPLFKDTEYNKYDPNFTKAYVGTPDWLVRASRMMNSIGNDYPNVQQNKWDALGNPRYNLNNPAVVDHVLSSYLGGAYTMGSQVLGLLTKSLNDRKEIKVADIPLFSKFVSNPDDRPVTKKQGDEFWNMKENHDRAANTLSKLKKQAKVDGDYSMLERFYGSEEYKKYKQDDVKVKKYEEDKKKERAEDSGEEYRPHKLNAEDIYKAHATPKDDFEDLKLKQLYTKLNGFKTSYDLLVDTAPSQSDGYYNNNKAAIDAIDEISLDKQEISELKKGFLDDGKDAYNAEDMKQIRDLRKKILSVLEKANKVVVANQKAKAKK